MLMETYPKKITTGLAIEVIIKGALLTILKVHPRQAGPPFQDRGHFLNHLTRPPFFIVAMDHIISNPEIQTVFGRHAAALRASQIAFARVVAENT